MDHGDDDGDGAGLGNGDDVEASSHKGGEVMMMTVISPFSGAPEQQYLIPLEGNQEFRRRRRLGWTWKN